MVSDQERADKAPLTGALSLHDVLRHLLRHGPARNPAELDELTAAVDADDPAARGQHAGDQQGAQDEQGQQGAQDEQGQHAGDEQAAEPKPLSGLFIHDQGAEGSKP